MADDISRENLPDLIYVDGKGYCFNLTDSGRGESCWTDEQGVQHWKVWDKNGAREFERR